MFKCSRSFGSERKGPGRPACWRARASSCRRRLRSVSRPTGTIDTGSHPASRAPCPPKFVSLQVACTIHGKSQWLSNRGGRRHGVPHILAARLDHRGPTQCDGPPRYRRPLKKAALAPTPTRSHLQTPIALGRCGCPSTQQAELGPEAVEMGGALLPLAHGGVRLVHVQLHNVRASCATGGGGGVVGHYPESVHLVTEGARLQGQRSCIPGCPGVY